MEVIIDCAAGVYTSIIWLYEVENKEGTQRRHDAKTQKELFCGLAALQPCVIFSSWRWSYDAEEECSQESVDKKIS